MLHSVDNLRVNSAQDVVEIHDIRPWAFEHNIHQIRIAISGNASLTEKFEAALTYFETKRNIVLQVADTKYNLKSLMYPDMPKGISQVHHFIVHPNFPNKKLYSTHVFTEEQIASGLADFHNTITSLIKSGATILEPYYEDAPEYSNVLYTWPGGGRVIEAYLVELVLRLLAINPNDTVVINGSEYDRCTRQFIMQITEALYLGVITDTSCTELFLHPDGPQPISAQQFEAEQTMNEVLTSIGFYKNTIIQYGTVSNARPRTTPSAISQQVHGDMTVLLPPYTKKI